MCVSVCMCVNACVQDRAGTWLSRATYKRGHQTQRAGSGGHRAASDLFDLGRALLCADLLRYLEHLLFDDFQCLACYLLRRLLSKQAPTALQVTQQPTDGAVLPTGHALRHRSQHGRRRSPPASRQRERERERERESIACTRVWHRQGFLRHMYLCIYM